jgi:lipopolysaccharide export system permease protein
MKKTIFNNLFSEVTLFFIICSVTLTLIVWIIQAVNFIDIISEDGHSIATYFSYAFLNIPKIYSKLLLLSFFLSIYYILGVYEDKNQLIIFWINGISKKEFLNKLIFLSILFAFFSFFLSYLVVPYTQNKARSFIRESNLDFFPSLIKPKKFIDTVENLTIFLDEKKENSMKNILIKDSSLPGASQLIISKSGQIIGNINEKYLQLNDGIIINYGRSKKLTSFNFEQSNFNLDKYKTKTTITPKIQETNSKIIIQCLKNLKTNLEKDILIDKLRCQKSFLKNLTQEIYKRTILPFYIPILCIIASLIILKSSNNDKFRNFKIKIFLSGILIIILSQISVNTISMNLQAGIATLCIPFILFLSAYLIFTNNTKNSS